MEIKPSIPPRLANAKGKPGKTALSAKCVLNHGWDLQRAGADLNTIHDCQRRLIKTFGNGGK